MAAGPTPLPPRVSQVDGRADHVPPRPRLRRGVRPLPRQAEGGVPDPERRAVLRRFRDRWNGVGRREPDQAGRRGAGRLLRQVRRALRRAGRDVAGEGRPPRRRLGQQGRAGGPRPAARREPGRRARLHHLLGDVDRRPERRPGAHAGRARARRADRRRRDLGPRRRSAAAGRVGRGRGRRRLAEGAHVPAGPRLRQPERARARARRRGWGPALLLRLEPHGEGPAQGPAGQPVHAGRVALHGARRRARADRGGGARRGLRAPPPARARRAAGGQGARARAVRPRGRELERRHRDQAARGRSTARRCRRRCATSTASRSPAARTS